jgi:hypothetical protein
MDAENRVEDMGGEEIRSLGKMPQCPVQDTIRARSIADLETSGGFVNFVIVGELRYFVRD